MQVVERNREFYREIGTRGHFEFHACEICSKRAAVDDQATDPLPARRRLLTAETTLSNCRRALDPGPRARAPTKLEKFG